MKNNKGITLIALVVTIIVLLILAGVSIAMLTGENGLLNRANNTKVSQIEARVDDEVKLNVSGLRMEIAQKAGVTATYDATTDLTNLRKTLEDDLKKSSSLYSVAVAASGSALEITYGGVATSDYQSATNKANASIKYTVNVAAQTVELSTTVVYDPAH